MVVVKNSVATNDGNGLGEIPHFAMLIRNENRNLWRGGERTQRLRRCVRFYYGNDRHSEQAQRSEESHIANFQEVKMKRILQHVLLTG